MYNALVLLFGVFITSWSSILIRWIGNVHPLIIAFYRLFFSTMIILPFVLLRKKKQTFPQKDTQNVYFILLAGLFLALHFFSWIKSLQLTTVGHSIFLESTHPVFALILSYFVLKERSSLLTISGIALALLGMYVIVSENQTGLVSASLTGDLLAIFSAFCLAAYLLIARMFTQKIALLPYLLRVYGTAAFITLLFIFILRLHPLQLSAKSWLFLILLALGPNLIGHSLLNWASRKMPVYLVNLAMQGEAVLATFYAFLLLDEHPGGHFYAGAILILFAVSFIFFQREKPEIKEKTII